MKFWNIKGKLGVLLTAMFATSTLIIGCGDNDNNCPDGNPPGQNGLCSDGSRPTLSSSLTTPDGDQYHFTSDSDNGGWLYSNEAGHTLRVEPVEDNR